MAFEKVSNVVSYPNNPLNYRFQKDIFDRYNEAQVEKSHYGDNIERIQRIINHL